MSWIFKPNEIVKNAVTAVAAVTIAFGLLELSLRWAAWYPDKREPPRWLEILLSSARVQAQVRGDPIYDVKLTRCH
jgi:hypothetical protein